jgi:hypothetical protein
MRDRWPGIDNCRGQQRPSAVAGLQSSATTNIGNAARIVAVIAACLAAAGSATSNNKRQRDPQRAAYAKRAAQELRRADAQVNGARKYCADLLTHEELRPLLRKFPLTLEPENVTFEMLALNEKPTDEERKAILALVARRADCHNVWTVKVEPLIGPPPFWNTRQQQQNTAALASLYSAEITYAQFNRQLQAIGADTQRARADEEFRQQMVAQAQAQATAAQQQAYEAQLQREMQERAAANARYQAAMQNFARASAPKPQVNCTSNAIGSTVYTNCQ